MSQDAPKQPASKSETAHANYANPSCSQILVTCCKNEPASKLKLWSNLLMSIYGSTSNNIGADEATSQTSLSKLSLEEFLHLRTWHTGYTPLVRLLFCLLSCLVVLWDAMLLATLLHFHITLEKVLATLIAVTLWFGLYRGLYTQPWSPISLPGVGAPFKYIQSENTRSGH